MSRMLLRLRRLFGELKRRKVVRVVVTYCVAAAGTLQAADVLVDALGWDPVVVTLLAVLSLAGLPVAAGLAWAYELVPERGDVDAVSDTAADDAAGASGAAGPARLKPLPVPATPFVGRSDELRELGELLREPACRLITVTGSGGIGKTRLALKAAGDARDAFRHGVVSAPLGGLDSPELLVPALAAALGLAPSRNDETLTELLDFLRAKELLVLLDTFEHLGSGAAVLNRILEDAPSVHLLVTSRERLNLQAETVLPLEGLACAPGSGGDAVALFMSCARRSDHHFTAEGAEFDAVLRICELLEGVPLAIELAAGWVRVLSCAEIVTELEHGLDLLSSAAPDLPDRHRSMRATFDASWRLLSEREQRAAAHLAVFRGPFDREAAFAVAQADVPLLRVLLDKSFLTRSSGRFVMGDVVRQYAAERLGEDSTGEAAARSRHALYFAGMLQTRERAVMYADSAALEVLSDDISDVRAAWSHAVATLDEDALDHMTGALFHFYDARGWAGEGLDAFQRADAALAADDTAETSSRRRRLRARVAVRLGVLHNRLGALAVADELLQQGVAEARLLGDPAETTFALNRLGANRLLAGDAEGAAQAHEEARVIAGARQDAHGLGWSLLHLGNVARTLGNYAQAGAHYRRALELLRGENDHNGIWTATNNLGALAYLRKDLDEAKRRFTAGLSLQQQLRNARSTAMLLHNFGSAEILTGEFASARAHLAQSLEISDEMGYRRMAAITLIAQADLALHEDRLDAADAAIHRALRTAASLRSQPVCLEALLMFARLRRAHGDSAGARRLAAFAAADTGCEEDTRSSALGLLTELGDAGDDTHGTDEATPVVAELDDIVEDVLNGRFNGKPADRPSAHIT